MIYINEIRQFSCGICVARTVAHSIYAEFVRLVEVYDKNEGTFCEEYCRNAAIIEGVAQSVKIKLESIAVQLEEFTQDTSQFLCDFCNGGVQAAHLCKLIATFKKECLLYEVSTFEEIMNCSVERLRRTANADVDLFVKAADGVYAGLNAVLAKYGIEAFKPNVHDMFDGKRHEVLMAEFAEGFSRGEIIKVLNCGYIQGGEVLLRANVVCSR